MQRKKMLEAARKTLAPWRMQGKCVAVCAVEGGLVAGLYEDGVDLAYIVTDGEDMHRMARMNSAYGYGVLDKRTMLAWTKTYLPLHFEWRSAVDAAGDLICRRTTGRTWEELVAHLDATESAKGFAAQAVRRKKDMAADCAHIGTLLHLTRYRQEPKGLRGWAMALMREKRLRHTRVCCVRVTVGERMAVLQYDAARTGDVLRLTLERIAVIGPDVNLQLTKSSSYCSWAHPSGWAIDKSTAKMAKAYLYPEKDVLGEFAGTRYAHLPLWAQSRSGAEPIDAYEYVARWERYGAIVERMTRAGMYRAAVELKPVGDASDLRTALGITKAEQRLLTRMDGGARELDEMRALEKLRGRASVSESDARMARLCHMGERLYADGEGFARIRGYERRRLLEYIAAQAKESELHAPEVLRLLIDTKRMEHQLHMPGIEYPRDVKAWHDRLSTMLKIEDAKQYDAPIGRHAAALDAFCAEVDGILIRPMRSGQELAEEGAALTHCVASYAKSYAEGACAIFCARPVEKPDESCVTVEVRAGKATQIQGAHNRLRSEDEKRAAEAVRKWEKEVLAKAWAALDAEKKQLAAD